jgi:hypothetical protein
MTWDQEIRFRALDVAAKRLSGNDWYRQRPKETIAKETIDLARKFEAYIYGESE